MAKVEIEFYPVTEIPPEEVVLLILTEDGRLHETVWQDCDWDEFLKLAGGHAPVIAWAREPSYPVELWGAIGGV